jgi:hypothetical protein
MQAHRWFTIEGRPHLPFAANFGVLWRRFAVLSMYFGYAYFRLIWEASNPKNCLLSGS